MNKEQFGKILLVIASIVLSIVIVEGGVRVFYSDEISKGIYLRDDVLKFRLKPNITFKSPLGIHNFTNSFGLPEKELPLEKSPDEYRILFLGDSCTHNIDVGYEKRFPKLIEYGLQNDDIKKKIVAINAGITGYNNIQEKELLFKVGLKYSPDKVILCYLLNDSFKRSFFSNIFLKLPDSVQELLLLIYDNSVLVRYTRRKLHSVTTRNHLKMLGSLDGFKRSYALEITKKNLVEIQGRLGELNIDFIVYILPYMQKFDEFKPYYDHVYNLCKQSNIDVIYDLDVFKSFYKEANWHKLWVSKDDAHPNEVANGLMAKSIVRHIKNHFDHKIKGESN